VEPDVKARVRLKRNEPRSRRRMFRRGREPGAPPETPGGDDSDE